MPTLDARAFGAELRRLIDDVRDVAVAEFLITPSKPTERPIRRQPSARPSATTSSAPGRNGVPRRARRRVGHGMAAERVRLAGRSMDGRVAPGEPRATAQSSPRSPQAALGGNDSFRRQLNIDLDSWMATFDSVLTRDSNGHQGVSVGDADGDGLDDLYVAQPAGLPNRLFRNRGDSTFEDITDAGGRRRPRRHGAVALCRRRQRRRSGSRRGDVDRPAAVHQRRQGAFHAPCRTPSGSRSRFRAC